MKYLTEHSDKERSTIKELLSAVAIDFDYLYEKTQLPLPIIYTIVLELAGKAVCYPR